MIQQRIQNLSGFFRDVPVGEPIVLLVLLNAV